MATANSNQPSDMTDPRTPDERLAEWIAGATPDAFVARAENLAAAFHGSHAAHTRAHRTTGEA